MGSGYLWVVAALEERDLGLYAPNGSYRCPAHDDTRASLSVHDDGEGNALVYCHAGCETEDVLDALGLEMRHLFNDEDVASKSEPAAGSEVIPPENRTVVARYVYTDEQGAPLIRVTRYDPKGFSQERWEDGKWIPKLLDTRRVLYNLPSVLAAVKSGSPVYVVEGEKDADALATLGVCATTNLGGAGKGKWHDDYTRCLVGATVIIVPDLDEPGLSHASDIQAQLRPVARLVQIRHPAAGKDISDHLDAGYHLEELVGEDYETELGRLDWNEYEEEEIRWLVYPYLPVSGRVLLYGKTGSLKSLWAMWIASKLAESGKLVAYFSLEMRESQVVSRLKRLNPPPQNFRLFTRLKLGDRDHLRLVMEGLRGFDLIVVDSWSATTNLGSRSDTEVADLDNEVLTPMMDATGATILLIDNTGHDAITQQGVVKMDRARGSSAKADKMDVTLFMHRPFEADNYTADLEVKKMRYDVQKPPPLRLNTPARKIDFWEMSPRGIKLRPAWHGVEGGSDEQTGAVVTRIATEEGPPPSQSPAIPGEASGEPSPSPIVAGTERAEPAHGSRSRLDTPDDTGVEPAAIVSEEGSRPDEGASTSTNEVEPSSLTIIEQLAYARLKSAFKEVDHGKT